MRKTLTILFMGVMALGLAACGKKGDVNPPPSYSNDQH